MLGFDGISHAEISGWERVGTPNTKTVTHSESQSVSITHPVIRYCAPSFSGSQVLTLGKAIATTIPAFVSAQFVDIQNAIAHTVNAFTQSQSVALSHLPLKVIAFVQVQSHKIGRAITFTIKQAQIQTIVCAKVIVHSVIRFAESQTLKLSRIAIVPPFTIMQAQVYIIGRKFTFFINSSSTQSVLLVKHITHAIHSVTTEWMHFSKSVRKSVVQTNPQLLSLVMRRIIYRAISFTQAQSFTLQRTIAHAIKSGQVQVLRATKSVAKKATITQANLLRVTRSVLKPITITWNYTNFIRNNSMVGAVAGTPGTLPTNWVQGWSNTGAGMTRQIVGTGTENSIPYMDVNVSGTPTSGGDGIYFIPDDLLAVTFHQFLTASWYIKLISGSLPSICQLYVQGEHGTVTENIITTPSVTSTMTRFSTTGMISNTSTTTARTLLAFSLVQGVATNFTVRLYAPQLEYGATLHPVLLTTGTIASASLMLFSLVRSIKKKVVTTSTQVLTVQRTAAHAIKFTQSQGLRIRKTFQHSVLWALPQTLSTKHTAARVISWAQTHSVSLSKVAGKPFKLVQPQLHIALKSVHKAVVVGSPQHLVLRRYILKAFSFAQSQSVGVLRGMGHVVVSVQSQNLTLGRIASKTFRFIYNAQNVSLKRAVTHWITQVQSSVLAIKRTAQKAMLITQTQSLSLKRNVGKLVAWTQAQTLNLSRTANIHIGPLKSHQQWIVRKAVSRTIVSAQTQSVRLRNQAVKELQVLLPQTIAAVIHLRRNVVIAITSAQSYVVQYTMWTGHIIKTVYTVVASKRFMQAISPWHRMTALAKKRKRTASEE